MARRAETHAVPRRAGGRGRLSDDSPLLAGPLTIGAGAESSRAPRPDFDPRENVLDLPSHPAPAAADAPDWFRVEQEGIENIPADCGALLISNHSGALPPDAPMIMQTIRHEHPSPRPLYMLAEHWVKGYPGVGMLTNKIGAVPAHPANGQRLLHDEQHLALVFPEGQKGTRKLYWQRYKLRRFGRGGFVRTAMRAGVPIVPIAVVGAEDAMPVLAHVPLMQRLTRLIYFPVNHAFPHFGLAAGLAYLPAKFKIRFLDPVDLSAYDPDDVEDLSLVQSISEDIRARIQSALDSLVSSRMSVWFG